MLAVLRPHGPYPVLVLSGEQGSAKSTFSKILRALLDPNAAPLRALPREDRDLFIAATNSHLLTFDNVSGLPSGISDTLCRLATGGGFAVRQLYTDQDEVIFDAPRPVILNGIEDIVTRPDLADRGCSCSSSPFRRRLVGPKSSSGGRSSRTAQRFWARYSIAWSTGFANSPRPSSIATPAWPTSPTGRPRVRPRSGHLEPSWPPTREIGRRRWTVSLRRIPWRRHSVPGWPTKPNGLGRRPTS